MVVYTVVRRPSLDHPASSFQQLIVLFVLGAAGASATIDNFVLFPYLDSVNEGDGGVHIILFPAVFLR
jgi:hypothetical protein